MAIMETHFLKSLISVPVLSNVKINVLFFLLRDPFPLHQVMVEHVTLTLQDSVLSKEESTELGAAMQHSGSNCEIFSHLCI